jgi:hypothetical protein
MLPASMIGGIAKHRDPALAASRVRSAAGTGVRSPPLDRGRGRATLDPHRRPRRRMASSRPAGTDTRIMSAPRRSGRRGRTGRPPRSLTERTPIHVSRRRGRRAAPAGGPVRVDAAMAARRVGTPRLRRQRADRRRGAAPPPAEVDRPRRHLEASVAVRGRTEERDRERRTMPRASRPIPPIRIDRRLAAWAGRSCRDR